MNVQAPKVLCANDSSPFCYFGWPSITRLMDGTLAMAASGLRLEHVCPFGKGIICYSRDEGRSWTPPAVAIDTPLDDRDAGIVPFAGGKRVMFTSFNNTTDFQRFRNGWQHGGDDPVSRAKHALVDAYLNYVDLLPDSHHLLGSTYCISENGGYTFGPVKVAPITSPHGPCELSDGTLLWVGRRFSGNDSFDDGSTPYIEVCTLNDRDEWEHLSYIENISDEQGLLESCEPHAIQLPGGRIIVHIRVQRRATQSVFTLYQSESTDGGRSFTKPHQILGDKGGAPAHLLLHSSGKLLCVYGYRQSPYGIRAMVSDDGGETWETDLVLYDGGQSGDLGYPATVELADGSLLTLYYENRDGVSRILSTRWTL